METLATIAIESNSGITKDIINEIVHSRFGELASFPTDARETSRALDFLVEELIDIYYQASNIGRLGTHTDTSVFTTKKSTRYTRTIDLLTVVIGLVGIWISVEIDGLARRLTVALAQIPTTTIQLTVETLHPIHPELEHALPIRIFLWAFQAIIRHQRRYKWVRPALRETSIGQGTVVAT